MNTKRWIVRGEDTERVPSFAHVLSVSPTVVALLSLRDRSDEQSARNFLKPSYDQLQDPYLMPGMSEALPRLQRTIDWALEPYGGNPRPVFLARNLCIVAEPRLIG